MFAGTMLGLTLSMILALGVRLYSDKALSQCEDFYRSIAVVEYMGTEYPDMDEPDPAARDAAKKFDAVALSDIQGVRAWYPEDRMLSRIEGFTRHGNDMPYINKAVLLIKPIAPSYAKIPNPEYDSVKPNSQPPFIESQEIEYYSCLIMKSIYSYSGREKIAISVLPDFMPEDLECGETYIVNGTFVDGDNLGVHNGLSAFLIQSFKGSKEPPIVKLESGEELGAVFKEAAEHYGIINNYVHTVSCGDIRDIWEFHQGVVYLEDGRLPENSEECIISGDMAESMGIELNQKLRLTEFSSAEDDRYDITLTDNKSSLTVVGITNISNDISAHVYIKKVPEDALLFGYRIGTAELENKHAVEAVEKIKTLLPENVRVTLLDQGYQEAVEPFLSLQSTSTNVLLLCSVGATVVLVLFALLFVGRQHETVRIMVSLGTPIEKIALWLLSGALIIAGGAALIGGVLGIWGLPLLFSKIEEGSSSETKLLRFSETLVSTVKKAEIKIDIPVWPMIVVILLIILLALIMCFLFLRVAYRGGTLRKGKSKVPVPRGKTNTFGSGSFRYALLSLRRGGPRAALVILVSSVLAIVIIVLGSVYRGWEKELDRVLSETKIEGQVTSSNGRFFSGVSARISNIRSLMELEDIGEIYVSLRDIYWMEDDIPDFGEGGFAQERRATWINSQSSIVAVNNLKGAKEFYFTEPEIKWLEGWDESCFIDESFPTLYGAMWGIEEGPEDLAYPAVVSDKFMERHNLKQNGEFSCLVRGGTLSLSTGGRRRNNSSEISTRLKIVGTYHQTGSREHIYVPLGFFLPPSIIFGETPPEESNNPYITINSSIENYMSYIYGNYFMDSCRFALTSAAHLDETRDALAKAGFGWPGHMGTKRMTLILRDGAFVKMTENLNRYLVMGKVILVLIFGVVALLGFIISWLLISGRKREFAIMRGFGVKKSRLFFSFFWEQALLCVIGCIIGALSLIWFYSGGLLQWATLGGYIVSYLVGCIISIVLIGRVNLMELLATKE